MNRVGAAAPWVVLAGFIGAYAVRPDSLAALTIFPPFTLLPFGILFSVLEIRRGKRAGSARSGIRRAGIVLGRYLGFAVIVGEEARSLTRLGVREQKSPATIRTSSSSKNRPVRRTWKPSGIACLAKTPG